MRITGIDYSLTSTGLVRIENGKLSAWANPRTKGKRSDTLADRSRRLFDLANTIVDFADTSDVVVIEAPSYGSVGAGTFDRSGGWWLVVNALHADDVPVVLVSPQGRAKYGTGKGNSKKDVVLSFVRERYTDWFGGRIPNDDVADALLLAAMGARQYGTPVEDWEMDDGMLAAMTAVLWPSVQGGES